MSEKKQLWSSLMSIMRELNESGYVEDIGQKRSLKQGTTYHEFLLKGESFYIFDDSIEEFIDIE